MNHIVGRIESEAVCVRPRLHYGLMFVISLTCVAPVTVHADVQLPKIFADHMVLQREMRVPIWGTAEPGNEINVAFAGQSKTAMAGEDGAWLVTLDAMPASSEPRVLTICEHKISDVLVGDVWICSGQSNMGFRLGIGRPRTEAIAAADLPGIRALLPHRKTTWAVCSPELVKDYYAVGFYFARKLHAETKVPVGLLCLATSGSTVEEWMPLESVRKVGFSREMLDQHRDQERPTFRIGMPAAERVAHIYTPNRRGDYLIGRNFGSHIEPVIPFAIRGALWYQGESSALMGVTAAKAHSELLTGLIESWREQWGQGDFAFLIVQLPRYKKAEEENQIPGWQVVQDQQATVAKTVRRTGFVEQRDLGLQLGGLHPKDKRPVGERLADLAVKMFAEASDEQ